MRAPPRFHLRHLHHWLAVDVERLHHGNAARTERKRRGNVHGLRTPSRSLVEIVSRSNQFSEGQSVTDGYMLAPFVHVAEAHGVPELVHQHVRKLCVTGSEVTGSVVVIEVC